MNIDIRPECHDDLLEGFYFYERQRKGLGSYFLSCHFTDIEDLRENAGIHETVFGLQRSLSKKFPYAIYYRLMGENLEIVAALDSRRDPKWIAERLK